MAFPTEDIFLLVATCFSGIEFTLSQEVFIIFWRGIMVRGRISKFRCEIQELLLNSKRIWREIRYHVDRQNRNSILKCFRKTSKIEVG